MIRCSKPTCTNTHRNHKWGKTKAARKGWFFQQDGSAWCPDHTPTWVDDWRNKKN